MRYSFIERNKNDYPVEKMCKCMRVSKSGYYHWKNKEQTPKTVTNRMLLKERIREIFKESRSIYGSARIQKMLEREGLNYSRSYISVLMKEMELKSVLSRKYVVTTDSSHQFPIANNKLNREFNSLQLGEKWVSDITYIRVSDNWMYLTTIMDLADRKIVGWSLSKDMTTKNTVFKAWIKARETRDIKHGFVFHSDRGVQYASKKMTNLFTFNNKITQSMSRKGNCWDNAVAESFFKTIKHEWLYRFKFTSEGQLFNAIDDYINWYNTKRIHSSLNYLTPLEKEIELSELLKKVA